MFRKIDLDKLDKICEEKAVDLHQLFESIDLEESEIVLLQKSGFLKEKQLKQICGKLNIRLKELIAVPESDWRMLGL